MNSEGRDPTGPALLRAKGLFFIRGFSLLHLLHFLHGGLAHARHLDGDLDIVGHDQVARARTARSATMQRLN